jgi:hypothetical protein
LSIFFKTYNFLFLRYGEDASILTENAAYAVGNTALTAYHVSELSHLGPKVVRIEKRKTRIDIIKFMLHLDCKKSSQTNGKRNSEECVQISNLNLKNDNFLYFFVY